MTTNGMIATTNAVIAAALVALGLALLWQARRGLIAWPVSAFVALAGPYLLTGLVLAQLAWLRTAEAPPGWERDGVGTLVLRGVAAVVALALLRRIVTGRLLAPQDRDRVGPP
jgi:hypothetical protein